MLSGCACRTCRIARAVMETTSTNLEGRSILHRNSPTGPECSGRTKSRVTERLVIWKKRLVGAVEKKKATQYLHYRTVCSNTTDRRDRKMELRQSGGRRTGARAGDTLERVSELRDWTSGLQLPRIYASELVRPQLNKPLSELSRRFCSPRRFRSGDTTLCFGHVTSSAFPTRFFKIGPFVILPFSAAFYSSVVGLYSLAVDGAASSTSGSESLHLRPQYRSFWW